MGDKFTRDPILNSAEEGVQRMVKMDFFPKLEWMVNLKKLVLIKFGNFCSPDPSIRPLLLDDLISFIFQEERAPTSLQSVWVNDIQLSTSLFSFWRNSAFKKMYYDSKQLIDLSDEANYQMVLGNGDIEQLGEIIDLPSLDQREAHHGPCLPNLKHFKFWAADYEEEGNQDNQQVTYNLYFNFTII